MNKKMSVTALALAVGGASARLLRRRAWRSV